MKRLLACFLSCILLCALCSCSSRSIPLLEQPKNLYVADHADVLSEATENYVVSRIAALKAACGGEIAVVTMDYLNDLNPEEYSYTLFNQWGIGDREKNNGMLLLLVVGENACWLTPGHGIEEDFPSTQCTDYLSRYLWQYQNAGDCDTGVVKLIDALVDWYSEHYQASVAGGQSDLITDFSVNSGYGSPYPESPYAEGSGLFSTSGILTLLAVGFVIFLLFQNRDRRTGYRRKRSYFVPMFLINSMLNSSHGHSSVSFGSGHSTGSFHIGGHTGGGGSHGGGGGLHG